MADTEAGAEADGALVRYEAADGCAVLTLDSPHNRNALSPRLIADFTAGLDRAREDSDVRAVVLTHTGGTFCAGADLSAASGGGGTGGEDSSGEDGSGEDGGAANSPPPAESPAEAMVGLLRSILECPTPVIARLDGHVRAGGMGLVGACDIVVAGPECTFALTEARLGLAPSIISLTVLPRMTSRAAGRYFLTGEKFGPSAAQDAGLVTVAAEDTGAATRELTASLRKASPQGLAETKSLTTRALLEGFDAHAQSLCDQSARLFGTAEAAEGMTAFLEKRRPYWAR